MFAFQGTAPAWLRTLSDWTPTHRFAELGTSVTDGGSIGPAVAVLTAWLLAFASYAVSSYRRAARTA